MTKYKNAYNDLKNQGMKGMVVDLRSNPGGSLSIVCKILDEILPEGKIVYTQDKTEKKKTSHQMKSIKSIFQ